MSNADPWAWIGGGIIFASTAYITYREAQMRRLATRSVNADHRSAADG